MNKDEARAMIEALGAMAAGARSWGNRATSGHARAEWTDSINETEAALKTMLQNAALAGGPSADECVDVRIAVGIQANGDWNAAGSIHAKSDEVLTEGIQSYMGPGGAVHFVVATVPLPKAETVKGSVVS